jgi:hypothetical protein
MEWIKASPGAVYDQSVEVIARYPRAAFWVLLVVLVWGAIGWVL